MSKWSGNKCRTYLREHKQLRLIGNGLHVILESRANVPTQHLVSCYPGKIGLLRQGKNCELLEV